VFTAAPCSFLCSSLPPIADGSGSSSGDWSGSTRTQVISGLGAPVASRCAASPFSPPSLFPHSPSSLSPRRRTLERGKTPTEPWLARGSRSWGYTRSVKAAQEQRHGSAPWLVGEVGSPTWCRCCGWRHRFWCGCGWHWGLSPWGIPDAGSQACPGSSCVPAGGPIVPSHARECGAMWSVGCWEGKVRKRKRIRLTGGAKLP
jgi:hypothetical protein